MKSLVDRPQVKAFLENADAALRCAVVAPVLADDPVRDACPHEIPCPVHGAAALRRLGFDPNTRQPEGPAMSVSDAEPGTDIGAIPDDQPDARPDEGDTPDASQGEGAPE